MHEALKASTAMNWKRALMQGLMEQLVRHFNLNIEWKKTKTRARHLMNSGIDKNRAWMSATNQRGAWWNSGASPMKETFPKRFFDSIGLGSLLDQLHRIQYGS